MQNTNLRKMEVNNVLDRASLERIATGLLILEEFSTKRDIYEPISVPDIVYFMQNASHLKNATFLKLTKTKCNDVTEQLNNQWENVKSNMVICFFVRK